MSVTQRGVEAFMGALLGARDAADELELEVRVHAMFSLGKPSTNSELSLIFPHHWQCLPQNKHETW